jgi:outer membrane protein assembly factor BamB
MVCGVRRSAAAFVMGLACAVAALPARCEDWPHWRGPRRDGTSRETSGWVEGQPWLSGQSAWDASVGSGGSSPVVAGGRIYTLGWRDGQEFVICLDADSGAELWRQSYAAPQYGRRATGDEGLYDGPSSTPELDVATGRLYTLGTDGDLRCWDTRREGRGVWHINLYDRFDAPQRPRVGRQGRRDYGYVTAPLLAGKTLIVQVGDDEGNLMGFDAAAGDRTWVSQNQDPAGHAGGLAPLEVEGLPCVAALTLHRLLVVRLDRGHEGETIAEYDWETDFANGIASPAAADGCVLVTSGYNKSAACKLRITRAGAEPLWEQPVYSQICTPVIHGGHVYWAWERLTCLDWATGEVRWQGGDTGIAGSCLVTADDRLLVYGGSGRLLLVESALRAPDEYRELAGRRDLFATDAWPHVVLAEGRLLCRDRAGNLVCFQIGGDGDR